MPVGIRPNLSQRFDDKRIESRVNLIFRPIETREVLHPFEIADCHATGIADDVGNHKNAASSENVIGGGKCRAIGAFKHEFHICPARAFRCELAFESSKDQDVARGIPKRLVFIRRSSDAGLGTGPLEERVDVNAVVVEQSTPLILNRDDFGARGSK